MAIGRDDLLGRPFERVFVPTGVHEELTDPRTPEAVRRRVVSRASWFEVRAARQSHEATFPPELRSLCFSRIAERQLASSATRADLADAALKWPINDEKVPYLKLEQIQHLNARVKLSLTPLSQEKKVQPSTFARSHIQGREERTKRAVACTTVCSRRVRHLWRIPRPAHRQ
jgi:hypothetical protein